MINTHLDCLFFLLFWLMMIRLRMISNDFECWKTKQNKKFWCRIVITIKKIHNHKRINWQLEQMREFGM